MARWRALGLCDAMANASREDWRRCANGAGGYGVEVDER